ncbi:hypothetical protein BLNAU_22578 [Blattamonas nauphoetae]|uniref:Uncharacterized protein n=1 Tax=Blattamonas nauphoetae TaxID=2049346 RepID=A0ABQ9WT44_9EUKA|nr:hypothetical protein BLNAU_22578 [Blattamonas nauphoetae]
MQRSCQHALISILGYFRTNHVFWFLPAKDNPDVIVSILKEGLSRVLIEKSDASKQDFVEETFVAICDLSQGTTQKRFNSSNNAPSRRKLMDDDFKLIISTVAAEIANGEYMSRIGPLQILPCLTGVPDCMALLDANLWQNKPTIQLDVVKQLHKQRVCLPDLSLPRRYPATK